MAGNRRSTRGKKKATTPEPTPTTDNTTASVTAPNDNDDNDDESSDRRNWNADMDDILLGVLTKEKKAGGAGDNNFKNKTYQKAVDALSEKGYIMNAKQCKSRWTRLKADAKALEELRGLSGFGWDDVKKTVTAEDDVWDRLLANDRNKKFRKFRKVGLPLYDEIHAIISGTFATGELAVASTTTPAMHAQASKPATPTTPARRRAEEESENEESDHNDSPSEDESESISVTKKAKLTRKRRDATADTIEVTEPPPKRNRPTPGSAALSSMAENVGVLSQVVASGNLFASPKSDSPQKKQDAFAIIKAEEGLSPTSMAKARRIFRGADGGDRAREYLSFETANETEREARAIWLHEELLLL